ncbi:MAG TPA: DUF6036 family nucleotidyltransferase [Verrucomicrobiae bacterium]
MFPPLVKVCSLLNAENAKYIVVGGFACILHGVVRSTEDVDILVEESPDNLQRVINALAKLQDGAAAELTPKDFEASLVIKIADEIEVDVSTRAWKVSYNEAFSDKLTTVVDGVEIPYLGIKTLLESKSTYREKDQADSVYLRRIRDQQK